VTRINVHDFVLFNSKTSCVCPPLHWLVVEQNFMQWGKRPPILHMCALQMLPIKGLSKWDAYTRRANWDLIEYWKLNQVHRRFYLCGSRTYHVAKWKLKMDKVLK